jgi:hypothetical protein
VAGQGGQTARDPDDDADDPQGPQRRGAWKIRHGLMAELAELSSNRRHIVASDPHHYVHKNDPDLVITAICDVVRSARTNAPLATHANAGQ